MANFVINVYTGDRTSAGTDDKVKIILSDDTGKSSAIITLDTFLVNEFEINAKDTFTTSAGQAGGLQSSSKIVKIELWKESLFISDNWFVNKIEVQNLDQEEVSVFPLYRWIKAGRHYNIKEYDLSLPQHEEFPDQRRLELTEKRKDYVLDQPVIGGPVQAKWLPADEDFSFSYKWDFGSQLVKMTIDSTWLSLRPGFESIDDMRTAFQGSFTWPRHIGKWNDDVHFGFQRLVGLNHSVISLVTSLPTNFPVTDDLLTGFLEGRTIEEAIAAKKLFIVDLKLLDGIKHKPGFVVCAPIALFYLTGEGTLKPVAIQLFQNPGPDNPIFTPNIKPRTWALVKMWFNGADTAYHQSLTHLGMTHILLEGIALATNRHLSLSHPVYKILAPHFLYVIAIDNLALKALTNPGGFIDQTHNCGHEGTNDIVRRGYENWRMDVEGSLPEDLKNRGLDDEQVLPCYYYRQDGLRIYNAIQKYVKGYVELYYTDSTLIADDFELQNWAQELVKERSGSEGGLGLKGVPGNGKISTTEELVKILTSAIYTGSVAHAATNFPQYDEYAFPPNYPCTLKGNPPTDPSIETTEKDILDHLVNRQEMLTNMRITKLLSTRSTKSLGDFEVQYIFDPKALELVKEFRKELMNISKQVALELDARKEKYDYLNPLAVPNSISI